MNEWGAEAQFASAEDSMALVDSFSLVTRSGNESPVFAGLKKLERQKIWQIASLHLGIHYSVVIASLETGRDTDIAKRAQSLPHSLWKEDFGKTTFIQITSRKAFITFQYVNYVKWA